MSSIFSCFSSKNRVAPLEICVICQEEMANPEDTIAVCDSNVPHRLHYECIAKWLAIKAECPTCCRVIAPERVRELTQSMTAENERVSLDEGVSQLESIMRDNPYQQLILNRVIELDTEFTYNELYRNGNVVVKARIIAELSRGLNFAVYNSRMDLVDRFVSNAIPQLRERVLQEAVEYNYVRLANLIRIGSPYEEMKLDNE